MRRTHRLCAAPTVALLAVALLLSPPRSAADEGVPALDHVIVVVMENHGYEQARVQPYTANLIAVSSSFANSHAVTHPSQPNYLALWGASDMGVTDDACPPAGAPYTTENFGHACEGAGLSWKAYSEALPAPGSPACTSPDGSLYTRKHAPWTNWSNLDHLREMPFTQFALDTAAHTLPQLAFVVPDNCHNTHNCALIVGDQWLAAHVPGLIRAVGPRGLVILTWDEDDYAGDNHILTVFAGPLVRAGYVSSRPIDHYSVVRTICAGLALAPFGLAVPDSAVTDVWTDRPASAPASAPTSRLHLELQAPHPARGVVHAFARLPDRAAFEAVVLDAAGRRVRVLDSGVREGAVPLAWDGGDERGHDAGAGVFFLRVRAGGESATRRFVRLR